METDDVKLDTELLWSTHGEVFPWARGSWFVPWSHLYLHDMVQAIRAAKASSNFLLRRERLRVVFGASSLCNRVYGWHQRIQWLEVSQRYVGRVTAN